MKYISLLLFLTVSVYITDAFSQVIECGYLVTFSQIPVYESTLQGKAFLNNFPNNDEQYYNMWSKADIYYTDNTIVKNKLLRYNALLDEILWLRERDYQTIILNRKNIARIHFHSDNGNSKTDFIKIEYKNIQHPNNNDMFIQLLSNAGGKVLLLKKVEVIENSNTLKFEQNEIYFIFIDQEYKRLILGKPFLYKMFGNEKNRIKQIIKDNKLSVKKEQDLIKAINIYNRKS